jgi:hypothetical protein
MSSAEVAHTASFLRYRTVHVSNAEPSANMLFIET